MSVRCPAQAPWREMEEGLGVFIRLLQMDRQTAQVSRFRKHPPKWTLHVGDEFERSPRFTTHPALRLISRCVLISLIQHGRLSIEWIERGGIRWLP